MNSWLHARKSASGTYETEWNTFAWLKILIKEAISTRKNNLKHENQIRLFKQPRLVLTNKLYTTAVSEPGVNLKFKKTNLSR